MTPQSRKLSKRLFTTGIFFVAVALLAGFNVRISGKPAVAGRIGIVDDWSTHHVIFSNPGTAPEALAHGRFEQWYKTVNDPRYIMQQAKRNHISTGAMEDTPELTSLSSRLDSPFDFSIRTGAQRRINAEPHRDWAVWLGTGGVAQGMYPAKFGFYPNATPSCTNDFVVYGLNVAGSTGGQANLVAFNELYSGVSSTSCGTYTAAQPYWAYNATTNGGTVTTSPVLSLNGKQVMYIESGSSGSYLHILTWYSGDGGTPSVSKAPTNTKTYVSACPANASCMVTVTLSASSTHTISYSSPFYDYGHDTLYVGDDDGTLYNLNPA